MNAAQLVAYIKSQGCAVRMYKRKHVGGCYGLFDTDKQGRPVISVATQHSKQLVLKILLHEFAHFKQWKSGFMKWADDISDGWGVLQDWLKGKNFTVKTLNKACASACLIEYDAELRAMGLASELGIKIGIKAHLDNAHSYVTAIKRAFLLRHWESYRDLGICRRVLTPDEVIAHLTAVERKRIKI